MIAAYGLFDQSDERHAHHQRRTDREGAAARVDQS